MNLRVEEYIKADMYISERDTLEALTRLKDFVAVEVRAKELMITDKKRDFKSAKGAYIKDWNIDGETVRIAVTRLEAN